MLCLTFDSDHMTEPRMAEWLEGLDIPGRATMYCTQVYGCLSGRDDFELGPHPYLAYTELDKGLPKVDPQSGVVPSSWLIQIERYRDMFPDARTWRSHSLVFSQELAWRLSDMKYDSVSTSERYWDPAPSISFSPWGVAQVPICYMDNADFDRIRRYSDFPGSVFSDETIEYLVEGARSETHVFVADLHPIHIQLNTPNFEYYQANKPKFIGEPTKSFAFEGLGAGAFFEKLLSRLRSEGLQSVSISEAVDRMGSGQGYVRKERASSAD